MADETFATETNLLREQRGPLVEALRWSTVLMSEIERDSDEESFDGEKVKIPIILAPQQGTGMLSESGTLNTPQVLAHDRVRVDTGIAATPVSFTTKAALAAKGGQNSWIDLIPKKMEMAEEAMRRVINEQFCGAGNALIAAVTAVRAASGGAFQTIDVGVDANYYQLYVDRVVDVLIRNTGATVSLAVRIDDVNEDLGTITTTGSFALDATMGIYIQGSYGQAIAGIGQATATAGVFQELDKANVPQWKGTDVTPAAVSDPTISIMDKAERRAAQRCGETPDFYIGDPAVIDKFSQGLTVQARWAGDDGQLETGWEGVKYRNKVLVREYDMPPSTLYGIKKKDVKIYTRDDGPDWDEVNGMFKRFSRSLPYEAWLVWHLQLGFHRCNSQVKIGNLSRAN